jgi:hypothetical protein
VICGSTPLNSGKVLVSTESCCRIAGFRGKYLSGLTWKSNERKACFDNVPDIHRGRVFKGGLGPRKAGSFDYYLYHLKMSLPVRNLGRNGPEVNAVGLGLMSLGGIYGSRDSLEHKVSFLEHAHAAGQRFWDTADMYLDSEDAVGEWVKRSGNRNDIFIATKFGIQYDPSSGDYNLKIRSDPEYVREACEKSLKRLNTDTIDLYYCHRIDGVTPIEKTIKAMVELKKYIAPFPFVHTRTNLD